MSSESQFPAVLDESLVGTYPALSKAGGGFVWDAVLEYRVWCCPAAGAPDEEDGDDYYLAFSTYEAARTFADSTAGADEPLALVLQREYIDESVRGEYVHVQEERVTEWPVAFLTRPRRTPRMIPDFMAAGAQSNRLDILLGLG